MQTALRKLKTHLRKQNLVCTRQRERILQEVVSCHDHFDADELYERLRAKGVEVSRATVYRTLPHLEACGVLREIFRCKKRAEYEYISGHHDHMLCVRCGRFIEFTEDRIERLQQEVCRKHGFKALEHRMGIKGICKECQRASSGEGEPAGRNTQPARAGSGR